MCERSFRLVIRLLKLQNSVKRYSLGPLMWSVSSKGNADLLESNSFSCLDETLIFFNPIMNLTKPFVVIAILEQYTGLSYFKDISLKITSFLEADLALAVLWHYQCVLSLLSSKSFQDECGFTEYDEKRVVHFSSP